jgi:hypothetical protein
MSIIKMIKDSFFEKERRCSKCAKFISVDTSRTGNVNTCAMFPYDKSINLRIYNQAPDCKHFEPR